MTLPQPQTTVQQYKSLNNILRSKAGSRHTRTLPLPTSSSHAPPQPLYTFSFWGKCQTSVQLGAAWPLNLLIVSNSYGIHLLFPLISSV